MSLLISWPSAAMADKNASPRLLLLLLLFSSSSFVDKKKKREKSIDVSFFLLLPSSFFSQVSTVISSCLSAKVPVGSYLNDRRRGSSSDVW